LLHGGAKDEAILGTADIQSLADLGNSYAVVRQMRIVPFGYNDVTIMPLEELLHRLVKIVF